MRAHADAASPASSSSAYRSSPPASAAARARSACARGRRRGPCAAPPPEPPPRLPVDRRRHLRRAVGPAVELRRVGERPTSAPPRPRPGPAPPSRSPRGGAGSPAGSAGRLGGCSCDVNRHRMRAGRRPRLSDVRTAPSVACGRCAPSSSSRSHPTIPLRSSRWATGPSRTRRPGWVVVDVRAATLNHHDVWSARGVGLTEKQLPMILGCDAAGVDPTATRSSCTPR